MTIPEIKDLKRAIIDLHKFCNGGAVRQEKGKIDKFGTGFCVDGRRKMCGDHHVWYDTHIGYYGSSSAYSQIELPSSTHNVFWKCFDEYLNEHEDEILNAVCGKMQTRLLKERAAVDAEINRLSKLMEDVDNMED